MKKIISLLLSLVFLLSSMSLAVFAEETNEEEELYNVARVENALAYATSEKNTLWTPAYALNDGQYSSDTWQGWECKYPDIIYGSDTSSGFSSEYCGIKFTNKEYYEIYEINLNTGMHAAMGGQNAHYLVQCLVEGVWVTVAEFSDSDTTPVSGFTSYEDAMENDTSFYHIPAEISFTLENPVTTNNVRVLLSEYAKNYPGGDVLIFPYIYEIELIGKRGQTPDLELPEGAVVSSNIGYHSYPYASSSADFRYPYRAIDGVKTTGWSPKGKEAGEFLALNFIDVKKINKAVINFGDYMSGNPYIDYAFDIEALVDGVWTKVASGTALDEENETLVTEYSFAEVEATALRVKFTEGYRSVPTVYEFEAHMSEEKTYYVENRFDTYQRNSASKGNIAITGIPYANRDFAPYSDVNYIIDGQIDENAYVWFTGVVDMPSYCGITFHEKQLVDRVALYFVTPAIEGEDIMGIKIQAKVDGEYVTLVDTKSYHKDMKYQPAFEFDPVETDDIRIYYTSGNGTFAHLRELEVYSPNGLCPMFEGLAQMMEPPTFIKTNNDKSLLSNEITDKSGYETPIIPIDRNEVSTNNTVTSDTDDTQESNTPIIVISIVGAAVCILIIASIIVAVKKRKSIK